MLPYRPDEPLSLAGTDVLIAAGDADPYSSPQQVSELAELLAAGGAEVELVRQADRPRARAGRPRRARRLARGRDAGRMSEPIAAATHMGAVHLTVADLERSLEYYRDVDRPRGAGARATAGATLGAGGDAPARARRGAGRAAGAGAHGPLPLRAAAARPPQPRALARARRARRACGWRARPITS